MNNVRFKSLHVWHSNRRFTARFDTSIGEIETEIELPREFVKEIESKSIDGFMVMLKERSKKNDRIKYE